MLNVCYKLAKSLSYTFTILKHRVFHAATCTVRNTSEQKQEFAQIATWAEMRQPLTEILFIQKRAQQ